jgi:hypothetical protein
MPVVSSSEQSDKALEVSNDTAETTMIEEETNAPSEEAMVDAQVDESNDSHDVSHASPVDTHSPPEEASDVIASGETEPNDEPVPEDENELDDWEVDSDNDNVEAPQPEQAMQIENTATEAIGTFTAFALYIILVPSHHMIYPRSSPSCGLVSPSATFGILKSGKQWHLCCSTLSFFKFKSRVSVSYRHVLSLWLVPR